MTSKAIRQDASLPSGRLVDCPPIPDGAERVDAGYGDYELIDIGRERWRLQRGRPVAYFLYANDHPGPWEVVWLAGDYHR